MFKIALACSWALSLPAASPLCTSANLVLHMDQVNWVIDVEPGGLVRLDPGPERTELKEALQDCAPSLSPVGTEPSLSTHWIDRLLAGLTASAPAESVLATGNAWSLIRHGDMVTVRFDYGTEGEQERETISVEELVTGVQTYRDEVLRAIEAGHRLDDRWWAQKVPFFKT